MEKVNNIVQFIQDLYSENTFAKYAVVGVSGGKDSSVVAGLCVKALGKERVIGVIMPNGEMADLKEATELCDFLQIKKIIVNIGNSNNCLIQEISKSVNLNHQGKINIAPRLRMATLYAIANSVGGLVANTSNYSEKVLGYCTKWGDNVGDFAPIIHLTMQEVVEVGKDLGLPQHLIEKTPSDGISGLTDEQNLGFTYYELNEYLAGKEVNFIIKQKIEKQIKANNHKNLPIPSLLK